MAQDEISLNNWDNAHIEAAPLRVVAGVYRYGQYLGNLAECGNTGIFRLSHHGMSAGAMPSGLTRRAWHGQYAAAAAIQGAGCHIGN